MKTYYSSPIDFDFLSSEIHQVSEKIKKLSEKTYDIHLFREALFYLLADHFPLDAVIFSVPQEFTGQHRFEIFSLKFKQHSLIYPETREQNLVILKNRPSRFVRMADQDDLTLIAKSLKTLYKDEKFNFIYFRDILWEKYPVVFALSCPQRYHFKEEDVALFFAISGYFDNFWGNLIPREEKSRDVIEDQNILKPWELPGMAKVNELICLVSRENYPVLILGETGSGKEVVANTIYKGSIRRSESFVRMNCANVSEHLIESELFGHERGSFTGASDTVRGRFERADKGVLLLDELGEFPMAAQAKLLRVLQEHVIERVGGTKEIPVDVRIIAATHRNLEKMCIEGKFRQDLLYRLNLFPIYIPPLRERPEDIPLLVRFFIKRHCRKLGTQPPLVGRSAMKRLCEYPWRGNVRELHNAVERAMILWNGSAREELEIIPQDVIFRKLCNKLQPHESTANDTLSYEEVVKNHILKVLDMTSWKISGKGGASEILGLNPSTLRGKMRKLGIQGEK